MTESTTNNDILDNEEDIKEEEDTNTKDASTEDEDSPTVEDYQKLKESYKKAEKTIVALKREKKANINASNKDTPDVEKIKAELKAELAFDSFLDKNPEYSEYKEDIQKYRDKGLSLDEAIVLVHKNDPSFNNRKKLEGMVVTTGEGTPVKTKFTKAELEKMSDSEYKKFSDLQKQGKVSVG